MSESIKSGDAVFILDRAVGYLRDQGKSLDDDDYYELRSHLIRVFQDESARPWTACA